MFVVSWVVLSIVSGFKKGELRNDGVPLVLCFIGAIMIIASVRSLLQPRTHLLFHDATCPLSRGR
jgi:hypothetical protein